MLRFFKKLTKWIINLIYPEFCVGCGKINCLLCPNCFEKIDFHPGLKKINLENNYLEKIYISCYYQTPISTLIKIMKYRHVKTISNLLGKIIYQYSDYPTVDIVSFVPIHHKRFKDRGFNQSYLIAKQFAKLNKWPIKQLLIKNKNTKHQASLKNKQQRLKELIGSFEINPQFQDKIKNKFILLIDDVVTTGSTLNECAKILVKNGAKKVFGLAVASKG